MKLNHQINPEIASCLWAILSKVICLLLAAVLTAPANIFALAPPTKMQDETSIFSFVLEAFDKQYGGDKPWNQPSREFLDQLESAARRYWKDPDIEAEVLPKQRAIVFVSGPAAKRNTAYIFSLRALDHKKGRKMLSESKAFQDKGIPERIAGKKIEPPEKSLGPYRLSGYDFGYSRYWARKVLGGTLAAGIGVWIAKQMGIFRALLPSPGVKMIYAWHGSSEDAAKTLAIVDEMIAAAGSPDAVYVQENIMHISFVLNDLRASQPRLSVISDASLLFDPQYRDALKKAYASAVSRERELIRQKNASLPANPDVRMNPGEYMVTALKQRGIPVVFEQPGFEAWLAGAPFVDLDDQITGELIRNKNFEGLLAWKLKVMNALILSSVLRERDLKRLCEALHQENKARLIAVGRGINHVYFKEDLKSDQYAFESRIAERGLLDDADSFFMKAIKGKSAEDKTGIRQDVVEYLVRNVIEEYCFGKTANTAQSALLAKQATEELKRRLAKQGQALEGWLLGHFLQARTLAEWSGLMVGDLYRVRILGEGTGNNMLSVIGAGGMLEATSSGPDVSEAKGLFFKDRRWQRLVEVLRRRGVSDATIRRLPLFMDSLMGMAWHDGGMIFEDAEYRAEIERRVSELTMGQEKEFLAMVRAHLYRNFLDEYIEAHGEEFWGLVMRTLIGHPPDWKPLRGEKGAAQNQMFRPIYLAMQSERFAHVPQGIHRDHYAFEAVKEFFALLFEGRDGSSSAADFPLRENLLALKEALKDEPLYKALTGGGIESQGDAQKQGRIFASPPMRAFLASRNPSVRIGGRNGVFRAIKVYCDLNLDRIEREIAGRTGTGHRGPEIDTNMSVMMYA